MSSVNSNDINNDNSNDNCDGCDKVVSVLPHPWLEGVETIESLRAA